MLGRNSENRLGAIMRIHGTSLLPMAVYLTVEPAEGLANRLWHSSRIDATIQVSTLVLAFAAQAPRCRRSLSPRQLHTCDEGRCRITRSWLRQGPVVVTIVTLRNWNDDANLAGDPRPCGSTANPLCRAGPLSASGRTGRPAKWPRYFFSKAMVKAAG